VGDKYREVPHRLPHVWKVFERIAQFNLVSACLEGFEQFNERSDVTDIILILTFTWQVNGEDFVPQIDAGSEEELVQCHLKTYGA
jgi:hypothetical protein